MDAGGENPSPFHMEGGRRCTCQQAKSPTIFQSSGSLYNLADAHAELAQTENLYDLPSKTVTFALCIDPAVSYFCDAQDKT